MHKPPRSLAHHTAEFDGVAPCIPGLNPRASYDTMVDAPLFLLCVASRAASRVLLPPSMLSPPGLRALSTPPPPRSWLSCAAPPGSCVLSFSAELLPGLMASLSLVIRPRSSFCGRSTRLAGCMASVGDRTEMKDVHCRLGEYPRVVRLSTSF